MARLIRDVQDSFAGGMNFTLNTGDVAPNEVYLLQNMRVEQSGAVSVRYGTRRIVTLSGGRGLAWHPGWSRMIVGTTSNFQAVNVSAGTSANVPSSSAGTAPRFAYWDDTLYLIRTVGTSTAINTINSSGVWGTLANPPAVAMYDVALYNHRLWFAGARTLYASKIDDATTWSAPDGLELPIDTPNGETIVGIYPFRDILIFWTETSTGYVQGYGNSDIVVNAGQRGISPSVGLHRVTSITPAGDHGVAWTSSRGLELFDGTSLRRIGQGLDGFIHDTQQALTDGSSFGTAAWFYPKHDEVSFAVNASSGSPNTRVLRVNLKLNAASIDTYAAGAHPQYGVVVVDGVPYGLADLYLFEMDTGTNDLLDFGGAIDGTSEDYIWAMRQHPRFGSAARKKRLRTVRVIGAPTSDNPRFHAWVNAQGTYDVGDGRSPQLNAAPITSLVGDPTYVSGPGSGQLYQLPPLRRRVSARGEAPFVVVAGEARHTDADANTSSNRGLRIVAIEQQAELLREAS